ncbi:MAG: peroxidase-related enzyme [Pirellulaceae bacterium]
MPRLNTVTPENATGETKEVFDVLQKKAGKVVNIFQGMGNSPAALKGYLGLTSALAEGDLTKAEREIVYLAVSERNGCTYCAAAHTMIGKKVGLDDAELLDARRFVSKDPKHQALLSFVRRAMETQGFVDDGDITAVREAGYTDGQITEAIGYIALATFSNLFNHVYDTELDFPEIAKL